MGNLTKLFSTPCRFVLAQSRTLTARIIFVLGAGVIVAQLIASAIWLAQFKLDSEQNAREVSKQMGFRVASTVRFFTSLPSSYRHVVLDQLRDMGGTRFFVTLNEEEITINDLPDSELKTIVVNEFRQAIQQQLGNQQVIKIAFSRPENLHVINNEILLSDLPENWGHHSLLVKPMGAPILVVQLKIGQGEWLYLATLLPNAQLLEESSPLSAEGFTSLMLSLIIVVSLGAWLVKTLTKPLASLADAATQFGHGQAKAIEESGSEEVRLTTRAFNDMQSRIQRYLNDREKLFASISHDLKTPITRLRLRAELLEDETTRESFVRDLEDLDTMVKGALQSVKETDVHENQVEVDFTHMLKQMLESAKLTGSRMNLEAEGEFKYLGKPLALKRCITNLIDNAYKHSDVADVQLKKEDGQLLIQIEDQGPGIPEDNLDKVFTPYMRLSTVGNNKEGMGLGLSIARNIARAHGGEIKLNNREEGGLRATVSLPL